MIHYHTSKKLLAVGAIAVLLGLVSCSSTTTPATTTSTDTSKYLVTNLVSDIAGSNPSQPLDPKLINAWGIAVGSTGNFWISSNNGGVTNVYDANGATKLAPVTIPGRDSIAGGVPTGVVFNSSADFNGYLFIYCTEDGILAGWKGSSGTSAAKLVSDASASAVYKGMALVNDGTSNWLYVADFHAAKVTVYDKNFVATAKTLVDPNPVAGYAPFNIAVIGSQIYVAYAKQKAPDNHDDLSGAGNGYINVFNLDGTGGKRFASNGVLNSPWGMTQAPATFGQFSNSILIGNFGDGTINAFDAAGNSLGALNDANGNAISITGLWGIFYSSVTQAKDVPNALYFTSGPGGEQHGLFGYIKVK